MIRINVGIRIQVNDMSTTQAELIQQQGIISEQQLLKAQAFLMNQPHISHLHYLHPIDLTSVLKTVPGRKSEGEKIQQYLESLKLGEKAPLCLHGSTGCGKTSLINKTLQFLEANYTYFSITYINCMSVSSVKSIYHTLLEKMLHAPKTRKPEVAITQLIKQGSSDGMLKLLVLDEIDQLFGEKTFMYNITEWLQNSKIQWGLIMISNMIDFSVHLQAKTKSRMKFNSILFMPYTYEKLLEIIEFKYPDTGEHFTTDAITYLCKKVASANSDVRLLEKLYESLMRVRKGEKISIEDVRKELQPHQEGLNQFIDQYKYLIGILQKSTAKTCIAKLIKAYSSLHFPSQLSQQEVLELLKRLQEFGLLTLSENHCNVDVYFYNWGIQLSPHFYLIAQSL